MVFAVVVQLVVGGEDRQGSAVHPRALVVEEPLPARAGLHIVSPF